MTAVDILAKMHDLGGRVYINSQGHPIYVLDFPPPDAVHVHFSIQNHRDEIAALILKRDIV